MTTSLSPLAEPSSPAPGPRAPRDHTRTGWLLLAIALLLLVVLGLTPSAYVIEQPGPVYDTLGTSEQSGKQVPLISIPGEETYPTDGSLDLLTVSVVGSPARTPDLAQVALAWFDPSKSVQPLESIYPTGVTSGERDEQSRLQMENSQQEAVAASLTELGYEIPRTLTVQTIVEGSPADGLLKKGDQITTVDGTPATDLTVLRKLVSDNGTGTPAEIGILRSGRPSTVEVTPVESDAGVVVGVGVGVTYAFPFDVDIELENVGGPSAGMMFALGIYDKLTPGSLTGGARVAGTGTIDAQGAVGAIGGIRQKLYGAERAGATWFLAPQSNCDEVAGHVPSGLKVVSVRTLADSLAALKAISSGADTSGLPTCTAG